MNHQLKLVAKMNSGQFFHTSFNRNRPALSPVQKSGRCALFFLLGYPLAFGEPVLQGFATIPVEAPAASS
jgi:hypothetical protein